MLVLKRKHKQGAVLRLPDGREIRICVRKTSSREVSELVIDAPANVTIIRDELYEQWGRAHALSRSV